MFLTLSHIVAATCTSHTLDLGGFDTSSAKGAVNDSLPQPWCTSTKQAKDDRLAAADTSHSGLIGLEITDEHSFCEHRPVEIMCMRTVVPTC